MCIKCYNHFDSSIMTEISDELSVCPSCLEIIKNSKPREYTDEEVREKLIKHLWSVLDYWLYETRTPDLRGKMEGLMFTILSTLDGSSMAVPGFSIIPSVHEDDKEHHKKFGENWYNDERDIGGYLHELLNKYGPTEDEKKERQLQYDREQKLNRIV